jgi:hypothetical protein
MQADHIFFGENKPIVFLAAASYYYYFLLQFVCLRAFSN